MKKKLLYFFCGLLILLSNKKASSQNYGDLYYSQLPLNNYGFFLKLVTNCDANSSSIDKTLHIVDLFTRNETHQELVMDSAILIKETNDPCMILPQQTCKKVFYMHCQVELPKNLWGYSVAYFSCCRDFDNLNINNGNPTLSTIAYVLQIPTVQNNSAIFANDTILNVCINKSLSYSFHAIDPDGDSLVYSFAYPKNYELSPDRGGNWTVIQHTPPYPNLEYSLPFSINKPIGDITINNKTGLISGTVQNTGTFLLTVIVDEYRNSEKIGSHQKEIVVQSVDCSKLPPAKAALPSLINECKSFSIQFPNNSNSSFGHYVWYFGDGDSSSLFSPEHAYADTGTYTVQMIMNKGYYCADSVKAKVLVYPSLTPDFIHLDSCSGLPITFTDLSTTTYGNINLSKWYFENGKGGFDEKPGSPMKHSFDKGEKSYLVKLEVHNDLGCVAVDSQYVDIFTTPDNLPVHDTTLSIGSTYVMKTSNDPMNNASYFSWFPSAGLSNPYSRNPIVNYNKDIIYTVDIKSPFGCIRRDSIRIKYFKGPDIYVPNAFTPNNDGLNDVLNFKPVGIKTLSYFRVYSRWGQKLFETSATLGGWNGKLNGKDLPAGVYIWELRGVDEFDNKIIRKGTITLLR